MHAVRAAWGLAAPLALLLALSAAARSLEGVPVGINATPKGDGWLFADERGMTLYTFDRDEGMPGKSSCNGDCATAWPPFLAAADAKPHGPWSLITREDGKSQWAYKGRPLYRYVVDAFAGSAFGDGVGGSWHVAYQQIPTPGGVRIGATALGQVLTDAKGLTLYASDSDRPDGKPSCAGSCLKTWRPVAAPALANPFADWSVVVRADGFRQWAFKGRPLYRYTQDVSAGETTGERVEGWHALLLEPAPPLPPFATVQASDAGELLANPQGLTLYTHDLTPGNRRFVLGRPADCTGECVDSQWIPLIAAPDAKPVGSWALVKLADGSRQWSFKGMKVYTNVSDKKPGDFKGIRFGGDRSWSAIMRSGQPMQGVTVGG